MREALRLLLVVLPAVVLERGSGVRLGEELVVLKFSILAIGVLSAVGEQRVA